MEENKLSIESGVGIGTILPPGSYQIEEEVLLLRVRLNETPLVCLIDGERRVKEILSDPAPGSALRRRPRVRWRLTPAVAGHRGDRVLENENELRKVRRGRRQPAEKFEATLQRFSGDGRACLRKLAAVLDRRNFRLTCEYRDGGAPGLKAYLIRELFKRTVREERGFKILLLLSHVIAAQRRRPARAAGDDEPRAAKTAAQGIHGLSQGGGPQAHRSPHLRGDL